MFYLCNRQSSKAFILLVSIFYCFIAFQTNAASSNEKKLTIQILDTHNQPLKNMVVFVEPVGHQLNTMNTNTLEVGQLNKAFIPYISVMQLGSDVRFNNKDNITHQIYSPVGKNKFSLKIRSGESFIKNDFTETGEVSMGCNIHDWMSGYLLIVDTPYFSTSNNNGVAEILIEKSGQYNVVVWHPQMNEPENKLVKAIDISNPMKMTMQLLTPMDEVPLQQNEDDFDFLSDY